MPNPTEIPDGVLIVSVLAGHRDQFAPLVERYQSALLRVARSRLGREDWAEDVVQETFLCVFKSLHSYDCPCIVSLPVLDGFPPFLDWVQAEVEK